MSAGARGGPGEFPAGPAFSGCALSAASPVAATPCWRVEDFVVAQECTRCSSFQAVSMGSDGLALTPSGSGHTMSCPGLAGSGAGQVLPQYGP